MTSLPCIAAAVVVLAALAAWQALVALDEWDRSRKGGPITWRVVAVMKTFTGLLGAYEAVSRYFFKPR